MSGPQVCAVPQLQHAKECAVLSTDVRLVHCAQDIAAKVRELRRLYVAAKTESCVACAVWVWRARHKERKTPIGTFALVITLRSTRCPNCLAFGRWQIRSLCRVGCCGKRCGQSLWHCASVRCGSTLYVR